jgi:hypothetical protein
MDRSQATDPVEAANAYAAEQGWPFRGSSVLEFEREELNQLRDIWFEKAAGRRLPYRSDFDARTLKPVLRNLVILEGVAGSQPRRYRIRLMGSEIARLAGEGTGRYLDECIPAPALPHWLAVYDSVMDAQVPLRFLTRYEAQRVNYLISESFNAPMLDASGNPALVLSCAYFHGKTAMAAI